MLEKEIKEAIDNDEHLYYYSRNQDKPVPEKPNYNLVGKKMSNVAAEGEAPDKVESTQASRADQDAALPIDGSGATSPSGILGMW